MNKEQLRLQQMLKEGKISTSDFELLSKALGKKSFFTNIEESPLINPFKKLAGLKALSLGLLLMLLMTLVGIWGNVFYDGIHGYMIADDIKTTLKPEFFLLLYQNAVACLTLSLLFAAMAWLFRQKGIRIIDFFGTVMLARFPVLISLLFTILDRYLSPETWHQDRSEGFQLHFSLLNTVGMLIFLICWIWQFTTCFFALKESSGLEGKRLWGAYLISMTLGDVFSMIMTRIFLYT